MVVHKPMIVNILLLRRVVSVCSSVRRLVRNVSKTETEAACTRFLMNLHL